MATERGESLAPYFDYYLGMSIIADNAHKPEVTKKIKALYVDFYGNH